MVRSSRVVHPPVSGVPVAGATAGGQSVWGKMGRGGGEGGGRGVEWGQRMYVEKAKGKEIGNVHAGSRVSMSMDRYTGFSVPTRSRILLMIPPIPITSISRASTISKPQ